jgi:hypothetical protein
MSDLWQQTLRYPKSGRPLTSKLVRRSHHVCWDSIPPEVSKEVVAQLWLATPHRQELALRNILVEASVSETDG